MGEIKRKFLPLKRIKANQQNPRVISESKLKKLINSLLVFPKMMSLRPITIDDDSYVLGGNMRLTALGRIAQMTPEELHSHIESLPEYGELPEDKQKDVMEFWDSFLNKPQAEVQYASKMTESEKQQFIIKDNVSFGDWDYDELENWDSARLEDWGLDMTMPDFGQAATYGQDNIGGKDVTDNEGKLDPRYSHRLGKVIYEPKETNHKIADLYKDNAQKFDELIEKIDNEELRKMLTLRAAWFVDFNFEKIADYYAYQATAEEQKVFEALGLVLLDYEGMIENGFSDLIKDFENEENH